MRRLLPSGIIILFSLALAPSSLAQTNAADEFTQLLADMDEDLLRLYPSVAVGRRDRRYLDRYEENLTPEFLPEVLRINDGHRQCLAAIDRAQLSEQDQISYDMTAWTLANRMRFTAPNITDITQLLPLQHFNGRHTGFARDMQWDSQYPFETTDDYDRAMSRMRGFARWIDQAIGKMREGIEQGVTPPRFVVEHMIAQTDELNVSDIDQSTFVSPIVNMPETIGEPDRTRIAQSYRETVANVVLSAYARLNEFFETEYLPAARTSVGLSAIPNGRDYYTALARNYTTVEFSPEEIHAIGLAEIETITAGMEDVKQEVGFSGSLDEFKNFLRTDPQFKFADEAAMMAEFERVTNIATENVSRLFSILPIAALEIRFADPVVAPTMAAGFYNSPTPDGARPGIFYVNSYDLPYRPTYTAEALELHEGIPGHHFQLATAIENDALPNFRKFGGPSAFVEGWGLYAEGLGAELGLYSDPYQRFGRLSFDAWRASRLVIDTGIHWLGWSREQGIDYLLANTALTETDAIAEVERYIAQPGQALAYKIGQRKFLELRERAEGQLGDRFDIRNFHDELLRDGAMQLPFLEAKMDRWIEEQMAG